jgi:hypothetical protein
MQRALIEQTTRSFSRAHNMDRWGAPARTLLETASCRSDSAHPLQEIQSDALQRKQLHFFAFRAHKDVTRANCISIFFLECHLNAALAEHECHLRETGDHSSLLRDNRGRNVAAPGTKSFDA